VEAERRQVTVVVTDVVGFTAFSERSGEEAAFALMRTLARLMEDAVREQGGVVQGFTGDGIVAVFGAPVAFEDAPLRACRAALAILDKLESAGDDLAAEHGTRPRLRIGVNSGPAVVGQVRGGADAGVTVLGDTVNFAARLQALAEPGTAMLSEATHRLLDGFVEASFAGEHEVKGKSGPRRTYRLDAIRAGATRFGVKVQRGLGAYVGRDRELEKLERGLDAIGAGVQVFDIVGEPGIGKSRLVHEFVGQIVKDRARVLVGSATPDDRQTPFRAFIEIVRGAWRLAPDEPEAAVAARLEEGLQGLGLLSPENLGLLLNLLGLKAPEGALEGLDGVLIGVRTRDLLSRIVQARGRLTPLVLVFEDLHWLDSVSEDLLARISDIEEPVQLLILHTRRPEYRPSWAGKPRVTGLPLEPLSARETSRIAQARLGVDDLPEALAKLISAKAEGNALFAEELASFLVERGIVRHGAAGLEFDPAAVASALPESVRTLLASRVDRLAPADRSLLQAAAVIGRRFAPDLVAIVGGASGNAEAAFAAMEALDLIHRVEGSGDYVFKHALVRDALYDGLLSGPRAALHLEVARELERRGGNRLIEIAETLAHHFSQTSRADKAFAYLAMAGDKSLDIYALQEAEKSYRQALAIFETNEACADSESVVEVVLRLLETLVLKGDYRELGALAEKHLPRIRRAGETPALVKALYYRALLSFLNLDFRESREKMAEAHDIAERLGDGRARAYARYGRLLVRSFMGLDTPETGERMSIDMMEDSLRHGDAYIRNFSHYMASQDYLARGLLEESREAAMRLMKSGEERSDPRAIGLANFLLSLIALFRGEPEAARAHAEDCVRFAVTPNEQNWGGMARVQANMALGRVDEALVELDALDLKFARLGSNYFVQDSARGLARLMAGRLAEGFRIIEREIDRNAKAGDRWFSTFMRVQLADIYVQMLTSKEKPPPGLIRDNLWTLIGIRLFGARRARALLREAAAAKHLSDRGVTRAIIDFNLGALSAMNRKYAEAKGYFEKARIVAERQGADKLLQRIDAALARLG
jgi:class 3 adenylate cyclase/tetratricopeptide (TPR) repeat protein